jgi:NAD(P)-dependent dehydrogenase (short-subunit alcohol dehydrogenase family)
VTARDLDKAERLAEALRGEDLAASALRLALADTRSIADCAASVDRTFGRLDALVNNAGVVNNAGLVNNAGVMPDFTTPSVLAADMDQVRGLFTVDVFGLWALTQACLPLLERAPAARVVNVSSVAALRIAAGVEHGDGVRFPGYALANYTMNALTATLAGALRDSGILVNAVCPARPRRTRNGATRTTRDRPRRAPSASSGRRRRRADRRLLPRRRAADRRVRAADRRVRSVTGGVGSSAVIACVVC